MKEQILSSDPGWQKSACITERYRRAEWSLQDAVFELDGVDLKGKMAYVQVRSAGSWKSGNKRTDGPNQIETESN